MAIKKNSTSKAKEKEINYEVLEECGELSTRSNGDVVKLRYLSWNGHNPKYDLRVWSVDEDGNERCGKGIGLTGDELEELKDVIVNLMEDEEK